MDNAVTEKPTASAEDAKNVLVLMDGIQKRFPGVHAIDEGRFELHAGEVHALLGENGAGKSTMMKVLAGVYMKDGGHIYYKGREVEIHSPKGAQNLGISMIHQELNLMSHLTVAQNIFIGREPRKGLPFVLDEKGINEKAQGILDQLHLKLDPRTKVGDLTVAMQQMVEIAKALSFGFEVLIMDEPTAALTDSEINELFRIIRELRDRGAGIVYISHRLEEIKQICDRITVMRDGHYIDTVRTDEVTIERIIHMMVGRTIYESSPETSQGADQDVILEVRHLNRSRHIRDVSFNLKRGEILGFAGLVGAGRTETARAIFGADKPNSGEIYMHGKKVSIRSPKDAVQHGIGYLSEDRKRFGLALGMDVGTNVVLAAFNKFLQLFGWVDTAKIQKTATHFVQTLSIRTPGIQQKVKNLSGGNQQKVIIGKWLTANTDVLIFDEPTRGIDVGAKGEIYRLLNELAQQGKAIIMISSELPEVLRMSHRIVVMCEGRITGELMSSEATQEKIMALATQRGDITVHEVPGPMSPAPTYS
ncbi:MAG: ribose transport system ATP-binding protein [Chloroflexia bacterium]|jgi:ribose transport system ATP-binding protein|nr:ribose transport system ATP-binding protein [Chloroflexia bacterium]